MSAPRRKDVVADQINVRPTLEDKKILLELRRKLGVDTSQIFRMAIRALATKEGVAA